MPMMVHLTSAKNFRQILRTGIHKSAHGVFCMPVLQDYYSSHQWLRELRRWKPGPLIAIYFRLDDNEIVECGPYWEAHRSVPAVEAVRLFREQSDTRGWEIIVPRSIAATEVHKVRFLSQILGWRYSPSVRDRPWCNCPACVSRGEFGSSKKREIRTSLTYNEIIASLHKFNDQVEECLDRAENDSEIMHLLYSLVYRKAGQASDFTFLLDYPSHDVQEALVDLMSVYKGREAKQLLQEANRRRGVNGAMQTSGDLQETPAKHI